ncbi:hypothetical protein [Zhongshania sp.]|uniref:hypothetical protein n=1 Tax=Zhongshania sp. TaxID=1971902 RepID=UPI003569EA98
MPFVKRDNDGKIVAVSQLEIVDFTFLDEASEELQEFLNEMMSQGPVEETDLGFIRVVEDVIELLISKNIILFTELPEAAQQKMLLRQQLRDSGNTRLELIPDDS